VHRWTRGDWQLLPILLSPRRYPLPAIHRWKMFDNLRRSLVAPLSMALLVLALSGHVLGPGAALTLVLAAFTAGPLMGALASFVPGRRDLARQHFFAQAGQDLARAVGAGLWHGILLAQHALMQLDAIVRALYRMGVSHRGLLQWTTAATAQAQARTRLAPLVRQHWRTPVLAALLLAALLSTGTPWPWLAAALCGVWAASPLLTWWASRPHPARENAALAPAQAAYLGLIARDTWRYFERCVGPEDHHLPPDNLQTTPHDMLARRTSPTNIGLYLLAVACARQFGWIDTAALLQRLEATLATLLTLPRHRGHFLNWYDTQTCAPLLPMYVSTVDSGNLSGHLLATAQACLALGRESRTADESQRLGELARALEALAWAPEFGFLYHPRRNLLHIGYRVAEQQRDSGFYDLLASESRLTSLLAIAKGDIPVRHWSALGRPFYAVGTQTGLRSWSGSMFEYLMPTLVLDEPHGSVLAAASQSALLEQMAYARAQQVPWGISESAYAASDHSLAYQYAPQGVPRLALRRTPPDELVIAPYATALAAQIAPRRASLNFLALDALSARGRYGFIEALDYSPARRPDQQPFAAVNTYMAHHQGMTLVALANVLHGGIVQRWGMANAHLEAVAPLLHERTPREVSVLQAPPGGPPPQALQRRAPGLLRDTSPGRHAVAPTHLLSNGSYSVTLRPNGAGQSRLGPDGLTRWRDDALRDALGSFFYLRWPVPDVGGLQPPMASLTQHPAPDPQARYECTFHLDRVCFDTAWPGLQTHMTVWVSPEDDIEFREIELRNLGDEPLDIELISAFDVTLADPRADEAHPAFSSLFVSASWDAAHESLLFSRKPRLATERGLHMAHFLADRRAQVTGLQVQTDRQRWLGRNRPASQPLAALAPVPAAAGDGAAQPLDTGLDPVCALSVRLRIEPHAKARLTFATAAAHDSGRLRAVVDKYRQASHVQRASLMSATLAGIRLRALGTSPADYAAIQTLTSALVSTLARPRSGTGRAPGGPAPPSDQRLLWRFGIAGTRPLLLVTAGATQGIGLLRSLAQALQIWAWAGVACDLVIINSEPASYQMTLQHQINALRERHGDAAVAGFHVLRADELSAETLDTLKALARVRLHADGRPLALHVRDWAALHEQAAATRLQTPTHALPAWPGESEPALAPTGEFARESGEFRFSVHTLQRPARPWINVLANPHFGAQVSEAGGGYTWAGNSRMNQLTAWSNDPVADPPAEWFLLQDLRTQQVWSVSPSAWGDARVPYRVRHGQGYTTIDHRRGELDVSVTWCVDAASAVKQVQIRMLNRGHTPLQLRVVGIVEWMMGASRADRATTEVTALQQDGPPAGLVALLCTQREHSGGFGGGTAFLALAGGVTTADWTGDRRECFDGRGRLVLPGRFARATGAGLDPCAALSSVVLLRAGETQETVFLLGHAATAGAAAALAGAASQVPAAQRLQHSASQWDELLGATRVQTPDPLFDAMVNRWLLYQTVSCRLWAKAGFYQAGGAYGFRDQLQDAMALAWAAPQMLRAQIVLGASRQFAEGDVQHWWHAPGGAGVRTHFSDDLLWLPHACVRYLRATGDLALLDEGALHGRRAIPEGAEDAYYTPDVSTAQASVYEHCRPCHRPQPARRRARPAADGHGRLERRHEPGGHEGRGESVWLGWFLCSWWTDFVPLARARGDDARALRWVDAARGWQAALPARPGTGTGTGGPSSTTASLWARTANPEARIDLIAQAWAVLSGAAPAGRQREAMAAVQTSWWTARWA
jgi:cyclic beta-1,2-glucan synthetase